MYKIYGITQGQLDADYALMLPRVIPGGSLGPVNFYLWCIKGEDTAVLVDTGMTDEVAKETFPGEYLGGEEYIEAQLKKIGVDPAAIETVIVSHLHHDHFSAYKLYPNATFYIQKRDIEFFTGPQIKFPQVNQFAADMSEVMSLAYSNRIRYLNGDEQIAPGIRVVLIGGHTPGSQVVVVTTQKGQAVICCDSLDIYQILEKNVIGLAMDLPQQLFGLDKIRELASSPDLIIPGHDPLVLQRFPSTIEGIAEVV